MTSKSMPNWKMPVTSTESGHGSELRGDLYRYTTQIVNVCFVGAPDAPRDWVLVDAGMPGCKNDIIKAAEQRFGADCAPSHIVLTHGHFDHVGSLDALLEHWDVPVYAHALELPFLTGRESYPPPDPGAASGVLAKLSRLFPTKPVNLGGRVQPLPQDGEVPGMPGWRAVHTPGHTPGHVSFFRDQDKTLIVGDAFVTVRQESLYKVYTQKCEISGPPNYFTPDWTAAKASVERLNELRPDLAITGHGLAVQGDTLATGLDELARNFDALAVPDHGRYVD